MSTGKLSRKHSGKRDAILEAIKSTDEHPSAQRVYDRLKPRIPGLSLGTVYRNISVFRDEGDVVSVGVVNREERFDGKTAPHPHLVCGRCGAIADLPCPDEGALRRTGEKIADPVSRAGFVIDYRKTVFYGLCGACAEHSGAALREGGEALSGETELVPKTEVLEQPRLIQHDSASAG